MCSHVTETAAIMLFQFEPIYDNFQMKKMLVDNFSMKIVFP